MARLALPAMAPPVLGWRNFPYPGEIGSGRCVFGKELVVAAG